MTGLRRAVAGGIDWLTQGGGRGIDWLTHGGGRGIDWLTPGGCVGVYTIPREWNMNGCILYTILGMKYRDPM